MSQTARLPWAVYLLFALILGVSSSPLLKERASQKCNARDVQIVKRTVIDPVYFCKWWNSDDRTRSPFLEFGHERVTAACKCITTNKTKRTEDTEAQQGLAKRQTTDSCRREVATQFTEPWHFCNFYNAYPRTTSPFKRYTAQQLLKLCNCVQGKSVASSTKKTTSSAKTTSKKTSTTAKPSSTSTKKISSTFSKVTSSSKLSSSSKSKTVSTSKSSSTSTKKTSSSSSKTISSTKISSSSKLPTTSSKSLTSKTSSSSSSTLTRFSTSSSATPQVITITQVITVTEGPKSSLSTATSTLVTTIPLVSSPDLASSSVTASETSSISESTSVVTLETSSSSTDASTSTTSPSTSETSSSTSDISTSTSETSSSSSDVTSSETSSSSTESITSATPSPSIDPVSVAQDIILTSSYQPFCSELLDYSDETSTVSSTTTEVSTTTVTVTTTDLTAVTQMYKRKRDIAPSTTECGHDHKLKREAPTPTPTETSASSSEMSSSGDSVQSTIVTPAALQTFSASVLSSACSAEITTTATTVTEINTESTVSTETSTKTISSTTTISIASSAPTGVVGYLEIRPVINAGAQYVRSDAATHMTDNGNDPSGRETFIITTDNKLYSVTNDAYYFIYTESGGDNLYWSHDASQGLSSFTSGPTDASGYSQLLFLDKRTAPTGVYYKFCLASDRGGSTGSHMYFYGADADLTNRGCKLVEIYFAPTS